MFFHFKSHATQLLFPEVFSSVQKTNLKKKKKFHRDDNTYVLFISLCRRRTDENSLSASSRCAEVPAPVIITKLLICFLLRVFHTHACHFHVT